MVCVESKTPCLGGDRGCQRCKEQYEAGYLDCFEDEMDRAAALDWSPYLLLICAAFFTGLVVGYLICLEVTRG